MSDPANYRSKEEVTQVREANDPISNFRDRLIKMKILSEKALRKLEEEIQEVLLDAVEYAKKSPEPDPKELYTDVFSEA